VSSGSGRDGLLTVTAYEISNWLQELADLWQQTDAEYIARAIVLLRRLQQVRMSPELLKTTGVDSSLSRWCQHPNTEARESAAALLSSCHRIAQGASAADRGQRDHIDATLVNSESAFADALENAVLHFSIDSDRSKGGSGIASAVEVIYRAKVRALAAALRRSPSARAMARAGELSPIDLVMEGGEEKLLTAQRRAQLDRDRLESLERCLGVSLGNLGCYVIGIDCNVSDCHQECERRHLEAREQARNGWPHLTVTARRSRLLICAGPERSGSTWLYNAVRLLHLHAKIPCDSYWIAHLSAEKFHERLGAQPPAMVCIKTHEWHDEYEDLLDGSEQILLTHRDLRGVCASYRRVKWAVGIPDAYVQEHMQWRRRCNLDLAYEDIVLDGLGSLRRLADYLRLPFEQSGLEEVEGELQALRRCHSGNAVCQITKLWPDHVSSTTQQLRGQRTTKHKELNRLDDMQYAEVLNSRFRDFQTAYGYV